MTNQFLRVAACTPDIRIADCEHNARRIIEAVRALPEGTSLAVFPELCVTGATCGDLIIRSELLSSAELAVAQILRETVGESALLIIGVPILSGAGVSNCAAVCHRGELLGLVPKFVTGAESRHFSAELRRFCIKYAGQDTTADAHRTFTCRELPGFRLGVEVGESLNSPNPSSQELALTGATVIANPTAVIATTGGMSRRRALTALHSDRLLCAVVSAGAGKGESTTDVLYSGQRLICEQGEILADGGRSRDGTVTADIDLAHILYARRRNSSFGANYGDEVEFSLPITPLELTRKVSPAPFIPEDTGACEDILTIQAQGLAGRLNITGAHAVIGLSGGLDSSLALLAVARAYDELNRPRREIHAITMPCFGTTGRTLNNARTLAAAAGVTLHEIDISQAVTQHLSDILHDGSHDAAYENAQARERTQVLMDFANRVGGLVVGTGDLSELALGWATYNGDHMSMYGVNSSLPKTLVRHVTAYEADRCGGALAAVLRDILDTPVSPELLPSSAGEIAQKTENIVGPYDLHDFFLYYALKYGDSPARIYRLAVLAFKGWFDGGEIKKWMTVFFRRFFNQQFKRSCMPDGISAGEISLSPRGSTGWEMPSDAQSEMWMKEIASL